MKTGSRTLMYQKRLQIALAAGLFVPVSVTNQIYAHAAQSSGTKSAGAAQAAAADPLLNAMQQELDRERELLLPGMQRPYFIEYRLDDFQSYEALANYGALTREEANHQRIVRVTVRIGDYASDSSSSRGEGSVELAPEDNDPAALRYALWTTTDEAYKNALRIRGQAGAVEALRKSSDRAGFLRGQADTLGRAAGHARSGPI